MAEQAAHNRLVEGSNPSGPTFSFNQGWLVEGLLGKKPSTGETFRAHFFVKQNPNFSISGKIAQTGLLAQ